MNEDLIYKPEPEFWKEDTQFCEIIVRRKNDKEILIRKLLAILGTILAFLLSLYIPSIDQYWYIPLLIFAFLGGNVFLYQNMEYEISLQNSDLTVTTIFAKKKRKEMLALDCKDIQQLSPMRKQYKAIWSNKSNKLYFAASHINSKDRWFAIFNDKMGKRSMLIFEPTEEMLDIMKQYVGDKYRE